MAKTTKTTNKVETIKEVAATKTVKVEVPAKVEKTVKTPATAKETKVVKKVVVETCKGNKKEFNEISNRALKAKITAYSDAQRTQIVKEFSSFVEAKRWLEVANLGTSLERASETGKPSRGYWWRVVM